MRVCEQKPGHKFSCVFLQTALILAHTPKSSNQKEKVVEIEREREWWLIHETGNELGKNLVELKSKKEKCTGSRFFPFTNNDIMNREKERGLCSHWKISRCANGKERE